MEASVLAPNKTPKVAKILRERFISVDLYTDLPDKNPEEREHLDLLTHFNDGVHTAIPVYLIGPPDGESSDRGEAPTAESASSSSGPAARVGQPASPMFAAAESAGSTKNARAFESSRM